MTATETSTPTDMAATAALPNLPATPTGIFDNLEELKVSLEQAGLAGSTELLVTIPVRKPKRHEYFRIRPGEDYRFTALLYEDQSTPTRDLYFVAPPMVPILRTLDQISLVTLTQFFTRQGVLGIFPIKVATDTGGGGDWQKTAMQAANLAEQKWIRMQPDMALGAYRIFAAEGDFGEPDWPDQPFKEALDLAFKDRVIATVDHPVLQKIRGRV